MVDYPAISGIDDPANVRVVLLQGKQQVNAPLTGLGLQPLDPMLTALAALVTVADRGLYFTGADAPALFTLTAAGRALLDDANAAAQLTTLGVSAFIQTLLDDADAATARTTLGIKSTFAAVATTSGTSIDFTGIPAGVTRITLGLSGVSTNNTANLYLQIGDSGGIENTGYLGAKTVLAAGATSSNETVAFAWGGNAAANVYHGTFVLTLINAATNLWSCMGAVGTSNTAATVLTAGSKPLSAVLDRVRFTTNGGVDTFDAGSMNISWE